MRKLLLSISLCLAACVSFSQSAAPPHKETLRTAANLKTGNSQDVLTSFYQLAIGDLTGNNKSFEFKSSLLAIKAKTDPTLWNSLNYTKNSFARNFVIGFNTSLDSNYRFKSNTVGFKYAIINKRDKTVFQFSLDREKEWNRVMNSSLSKYLKTLNNDVTDSNFIAASNFFNSQNVGNQTPVANLPSAFRDTLNKELQRYSAFNGLSLSQYQNHLQSSYDSLSKIVENQPLWVVNADFTSGADGTLFTGLKFGTEYLKGMINNNAKSNLELHLKATATFDDDSATLGRDLKRGVFSAFAGFNWIILKNAQRKSVLEIKGGLSENYIMSAMYSDEKQINFTGEGTLRVRLTNNLWVPFDVKYDPHSGNVLGFISVKSNFDWLNAARKYLAAGASN